jgi:hypothetical protein
MRAWALALVFAGCGFSAAPGTPNGGSDGDDGGDPGGGGSMPPGGPGGGGTSTVVHVCLGAFLQVCADVPRGPINLTAGTLDTSASSKCLPPGAYTTQPAVDACVIASQTITVPKDTLVSVTGKRRLILIAEDALAIAGTLDAASHHGGLTGPAADSGPCPMSGSEPTTVTQGAGAWGATFGASGGNGGNTTGGAIGGIAGSRLQIAALGGGCPGGNGADNDQHRGGGKGGHGGGAVVLLAGHNLTIDGVVNASGGGGSGGDAVSGGGGGGGGGGAGGMIVVDAPTVRISGQCFANGGAGGQGSSLAAGDDGGESSAPDKPASNKNRNAIGGAGGAGGIAGTGGSPGNSGSAAVTSLIDSGGGGAGGGGVGIIKIRSADPGNTGDGKKVSPPPT